jgi:hypothetical protein
MGDGEEQSDEQKLVSLLMGDVLLPLHFSRLSFAPRPTSPIGLSYHMKGGDGDGTLRWHRAETSFSLRPSTVVVSTC